MYNVAYLLFRIIFGVEKKDVIYEKRKSWIAGSPEESMTFAVKIGDGGLQNKALNNTIIAIVQPSEPESTNSHSRNLLKDHDTTVHLQHVALRTSDLLDFHRFAIDRGINFITPIMKDQDEDVIQVFSGEWFLPGTNPSALFFEFVQRNPTEELLKKIETHNRESWFRDKTFLGLYAEKERENRNHKVTPFIDDELFSKIQSSVKNKKLWEVIEDDVIKTEKTMLEYVKAKPQAIKQK